MGGELIAGLAGGLALVYSVGRLARANIRETRRERQLAERREKLDAQYARLEGRGPRHPEALSEYDKGFLAGATIPRSAMGKEHESERRATAHSR